LFWSFKEHNSYWLLPGQPPIYFEPTAAVYAAYDEYDFTPFDQAGSGEAVRLDEVEVPR